MPTGLVPHFVKNAASAFLASGEEINLLAFERLLKEAVAKVSGNDQKIALLDEAARDFVAFPDRDGRLQVIMDFVESQQRLLRDELS